MHTLVIIVHIIACFLMIGAILLQSGKGAEIGAVLDLLVEDVDARPVR